MCLKGKKTSRYFLAAFYNDVACFIYMCATRLIFRYIPQHHAQMVSSVLPHWGRVTHIWVSNITIIGSDNSLSPGRQAII